MRGGRRISAKHETSINKRTVLITTCNKVRNENSTVNIRVKTFAETGVVCNANKYVKLTRTLCVRILLTDAIANSLRHPVINYHSNALHIQVTAGR